MPLKTVSGKHADPRKGRGAGINPEGRFEHVEREAFDDGWDTPDEDGPAPLKTQVTVEQAKSIIARNDSPDICFSQSINPYQGCEHGCIYCYARPSHAYRNLSPGIDFETRLFAKVNAAELLRNELSRRGYVCDEIMIGANTDPYQPIEREFKITRSILEVCSEFNQPVGLITKNAGIERDIDILAPMAEKRLAGVTISCNNLDHEVARRLEPRCSAPTRRLQAMKRLSEAGIPVCVLVAPVIPFLTDQQIEPVLEAAWEHGARQAGYVLLRLPWEVKDLFKDWLERNYPLKAKHVMSRVHEMRKGRDNDPCFGSRMIGSGRFAELLEQRFDIACKRIGFNARRGRALEKSLFRVPGVAAQILTGPLFDSADHAESDWHDRLRIMPNPLRRQFLIALASAPVALAVPAAETDPAAARIRAFYDVLLETMKRAQALGVKGRYEKLAPAVRATFDLPTMTRIAVGPEWKSLKPEQQASLGEQFARMTIATYASRFDGYSGERFEVDPVTEPRNANRIVRTKLIPKQQEPILLNYLVHQTSDGWKVIDVYLSGTISELATRRSEFSSILKSGGAQALIDSLRERADKMLSS
jgi:hopanoid biosynthesis associated membrane protein HpnM